MIPGLVSNMYPGPDEKNNIDKYKSITPNSALEVLLVRYKVTINPLFRGHVLFFNT